MTCGGPVEEVLARARDAGYTAVGFGVLAVQKAQVHRRELTKALSSDLTALVGGKAGARRLAHQIDRAVDPILDDLEERLPSPARRLFHRARAAGRAVEHSLLA